MKAQLSSIEPYRPLRCPVGEAVDDNPPRAPCGAERFSHTYSAAEPVFLKGSHGRSMYIVVEGRVGIYAGSAASEPLTTLGIGQSFGEIALIDEGVRTATVRAIDSPTRLVEIDKARFVYLVGQQPAFVLTVLRGLARRVTALTIGDGNDSPGVAP